MEHCHQEEKRVSNTHEEHGKCFKATRAQANDLPKEWRSKEQECAADTPSMNHSPSEEMYALEIASSRSVSTCTTLRRIPCLLALWNCEKEPVSVAATQIHEDLRQFCYRSC